jgi:hypothetical protein
LLRRSWGLCASSRLGYVSSSRLRYVSSSRLRYVSSSQLVIILLFCTQLLLFVLLHLLMVVIDLDLVCYGILVRARFCGCICVCRLGIFVIMLYFTDQVLCLCAGISELISYFVS